MLRDGNTTLMDILYDRISVRYSKDVKFNEIEQSILISDDSTTKLMISEYDCENGYFRYVIIGLDGIHHGGFKTLEDLDGIIDSTFI